MEDNWKQVPPEFVHGLENVWATPYGKVRINNIECIPHKGPKGKSGIYPMLRMNGRTVYVHRLVYFAHSGKSNEELKNGRVLFGNYEGITNANGLYRCWIEDLIFENTSFNVSELSIPSTEETFQHKYGPIVFGKWMPVYTLNKDDRTLIKSEIYDICFINNSETPCIIKNKVRDSINKYHMNNGHDGSVMLNHNKKNIKYLLSHIMLASAFPNITPLKTADHIDNDSKNHSILNLCWMTSSENCKKGQKQQRRIKKEHAEFIPGEIWNVLPLSEYTKTNYEVSNRGRVKRKGYGFLNGNVLRGKKYTYYTITTEPCKHEKYYAHQLVYATFHGKLNTGQIILHNDMAPLNSDGTYRNWAEDLRAGTKSENNYEHHAAKRTIEHV